MLHGTQARPPPGARHLRVVGHEPRQRVRARAARLVAQRALDDRVQRARQAGLQVAARDRAKVQPQRGLQARQRRRIVAAQAAQAPVLRGVLCASAPRRQAGAGGRGGMWWSPLSPLCYALHRGEARANLQTGQRPPCPLPRERGVVQARPRVRAPAAATGPQRRASLGAGGRRARRTTRSPTRPCWSRPPSRPARAGGSFSPGLARARGRGCCYLGGKPRGPGSAAGRAGPRPGAPHGTPGASAASVQSGPRQALARARTQRALTHAGRPELPWKRRSTAYTRQDLPRSWGAAREREHAAQTAGTPSMHGLVCSV